MFLPLKDENPTRGVAWVTGGLIVANAFAFVLPWFSGGLSADWLAVHYGLVPARLTSVAISGTGEPGAWVTLFTSMFLHANFLHLGGNLLYLWIFGNNVEDVLGPARFVLFYVLVGLGAHAAHVATDLRSVIPTIGASGAISGILGAYLLRYPKARVLSVVFLFFFFRFVWVPAGVVIAIWLVFQVVGGLGDLGSDGGGVAWFEHLGGFAAGLVVFPLLGGRRPRSGGGRKWAR